MRSAFSVSAANALVLGSVLFAYPLAATAQRHGGGGMAGGGLSGNSRPSGVKEEDTLKDFHEAMALQATSQQTAEFQVLIKNTETLKAELQTLREQLHNENGAPESVHPEALDQALENARSGTKTFQQGFSPAQRSGLKDVAK